MSARRIEYMPLGKLERAPRNPKRHDAEGIGASVGHFGLVETPALDDRTGRLVAGHGRLDDLLTRREAGQAPPDGVQVSPEGEWLVPVLRGWASRSDADAEAYLVASNQLTAKAGWDREGLAELLGDLQEQDAHLATLTGFDEKELDDLARFLEPPSLDEFAGTLRAPQESDGWPVVRIKAPHHLAAAWDAHLEAHDGDEAAALAALLGVDPEPPKWNPDLNPAWATHSTAVPGGGA